MTKHLNRCIAVLAAWVLSGTLWAARAAPSRIVNFSILTQLASAGDDFTLGYVVGGEGTSGAKPLLIRAAGPALGTFGVGGTLANPRLEVFSGSTALGANDDWGGSDELTAAMVAVGAFPFANGASRDAALLASAMIGGNSVRISSRDNGLGRVLAEIYDATAAQQLTAATPRLVNVSVLKDIGSGVAAGFVIAGEGSKTLLIRAIGPTLAAAPFDVGGSESNPRLALIGAGGVRLGGNDDWGGTPALADAFAATGAFDLPATSRDAALLVALPAGEYSVLVEGASGGAGVGLIEIYEVAKDIVPRPSAAPFTIAVLPDTQYYTKPTSGRNGTLAMFTAQTDWIQSNHRAENIVYVAHVGDIVDDGDSGGSPPAATQWVNADNAMRRLEAPVSIPYGMAVGNHEQEPNGDVNGTTNRYNETFGVARFTGRAYYGGHYGTNNNNHYDLFSAGGRDFLAVYVEYDAGNQRPEVTAWANQIIAAHPTRKTMLVTHYLAGAGNNYAAFGAQGARLYTAMRGNDNLFLAVGGHVGGVFSFRRDPVGAYGRETMISMVADYQFEPLGGGGFMRLYRFSPDYGYMTCRTYSPHLDEYRTDYGNDFTQSLDPRGPAEEGVVALSNNTLVVAAVLSRLNGADLPGFSTVAVNFQAAPKTNRWAGWRPLVGRSGFRQVHLVALSDDRLAVFAVGQASDAWVCWQTAPGPGGIWLPWIQIPNTPLQADGSRALSYVKGVRLAGDQLAAVGWTDGGAVFHARQTGINGPFGGWSSLGGSEFRQGDVVRLSDDRLAVFAVGHDTAVQVNIQQSANGGWGGWTTIPAGGSVYSHVSAIARSDNALAVFATRVTSPNQVVRSSTLAANAANWTTFANLGNGGSGFARIHAVLRPDGRIALFGSADHGLASHCVQLAAGGSFGPWQPLGPSGRSEIGSVKGVALTDNSLAAVSHGAATGEYCAWQLVPDGNWIPATGLPVAWTR